MKPVASNFFLCLLFALPAFSIPSHASAAQTAWLQVRSSHYIVITDAGETRGREVALRFEQMRNQFGILISRDRLNQSIPLTILAFSNDKDYYQTAPLHNGQPIDVPGFFLTGEDQDFIVLNLSESDAWRSVAHDFAGMMLTYNYPPAQPWFDSGITDYFSSIRIDAKQVSLGGEPYSSASGSSGHSQSFPSILSSQTWLSIPDLLSAKQEAFPTNPMYEAESWIVMNYLIHENKLEETGKYLGLTLNQHLSVDSAVQQSYGISAAQLEQAVKDYFHTQAPFFGAGPQSAASTGPIEHSPVPVSSGDSAILASPFPETDFRAFHAGVQDRIPERREVGLKTLQQLATTPTEVDKKVEARQTKRVGEDSEQLPSNAIGNALAHRFLAWDDIEHNQFDDAFREIGDASSLDRQDMWTRYYFCVAKYRMAQFKRTEISGLPNMMIDLRYVLEWNQEMAEAYDLLALARSAGGSSTAAMQSERAAMSLSPRNERYTLHLAQIYVSSKKWDAANFLLDRLKTSSDPQIVAGARELLAQAEAEHKYGIPTNGAPTASASQPKPQPQKSPFDVLDEDAAKREAAEKSAQEGTADMRSTRFVKGRLVAVDCSSPPTAVLTVSSSSGIIKLRAADYKSLLLIGADDFSCDWHNREVTANYKTGVGSENDLVSLELR